MAEEFDPATDAHLQGVITAAREDLRDGSRWRRRTSAFLVIDHYQSVLAAAARTIRRELRGGMSLEAMNVVFAAIPDLPQEAVSRIEGLRDMRNKLDHRPGWAPGERELVAYIDWAEAARDLLMNGAERTRERLASMEDVPRMFAEIAIAIRGLEAGFIPDAGGLDRYLTRADEIARAKSPTICAEDVRIYADLVTLQKEVSGHIDEYYQDMANSAAHDDYKARTEDY